MAAKKAKARTSKPEPDNTLHVSQREGEPASRAVARAILAPDFRHGQAAHELLHGLLAVAPEAPGMTDYANAIAERCENAAKGDLAFASRMLAAQAMTLDSIFAEMARRMAMNMGEYMVATKTYAGIALKAQAGSRATIEALAKLHSPREQTVRHVHVNEGGQAVIADQFPHHQSGGAESDEATKQPHTKRTRGTSLPCPNPLGIGVPVPGHPGQEPVPDARRQGQRRT